ncbi:SLAC1 family transporter [Caldicellulosiruptor morganii]|uniref:C4-dicarboxylate ABC transporter n=1 Tax=Caldicellulosiruptor morganii TaxID=1387555 RepID=A0ABY7BRN1_9FIRM|nr:C4-dicarboxylate ABC transporter [Caldicellulosiruptor morganii]WAM34281.1 C4-dicarboxylate ABC transporter [Caldicellulosiruptor morganii]
MKSIIKNFYPSWFVVCMGTGIMANLFMAIGFKRLSYIAALLNFVFFIIIFAIWLVRWFVAFDGVVKDIKNPLISNYFATMPISLLILGANVIINQEYFGRQFSQSFAVFSYIAGLLLMTVFSVMTFIVHLSHTEIPNYALNFAYFMPPVGNLIVTILGNELVNRNAISESYQSLVVFINSAMFGLGFMLFLAYLPVIKGRFLLYEPIERSHFPTMFILLAPVGASIVALQGLENSFKNLKILSDGFVFDIISYFLWGFGAWILISLIILLIIYINKKLPFSLAYWAFVFPVGIYVLASIKINMSLHFNFLNVFSKISVWILFAVWIINFILTIINVANKKLLTR